MSEKTAKELELKRRELDELMREESINFKNVINSGDGTRGILYISGCKDPNNSNISLEMDRELFVACMYQLMTSSPEILEDVMKAMHHIYLELKQGEELTIKQ